MPANIAFAGGNGCKRNPQEQGTSINGLFHVLDLDPHPWMVPERVYRMSTEHLSDFMKDPCLILKNSDDGVSRVTSLKLLREDPRDDQPSRLPSAFDTPGELH